MKVGKPQIYQVYILRNVGARFGYHFRFRSTRIQSCYTNNIAYGKFNFTVFL